MGKVSRVGTERRCHGHSLLFEPSRGELAVPVVDVKRGATKPAIGLVGSETRPTLVVHATSRAPNTAYVAIPYRSSTFWIDDSDFDSKYALTVVQDLMALAEVPDATHAPVVTVPAN